MLSISEVGKLSGLHNKTVRNYVKQGIIEAQFIDGQYAIPESELVKLPKPYKKHNQPREETQKEGFVQEIPFLEIESLQLKRLKVEALYSAVKQLEAIEA